MKKTDLRVGDLIAFQIGEIDGFSAPNKDKWGVFKILHLGDKNDQSFSLSVKQGLWNDCPSAWRVKLKPLLIEKRFEKIKAKPLIFTTPFDCKIDLISAKVIGRELLHNKPEAEAIKKIKTSGHTWKVSNISNAVLALDHEARAINDSERWKDEIEKFHVRFMEKHLAQEKRQKERLKDLSFDILFNEKQFSNWDDRTQILPKQYISKVRKEALKLLTSLKSLETKPKRDDVRKHLKNFVMWLNSIDGKYGYRIETEEREDLMEFIEEICWAAKQKPLIDEVDQWRTW